MAYRVYDEREIASISDEKRHVVAFAINELVISRGQIVLS